MLKTEIIKKQTKNTKIWYVKKLRITKKHKILTSKKSKLLKFT